MQIQTLQKAKDIYKRGGVERVAPTTYHVHSTSGETYAVELTLDRCSCPADVTCSHISAVNIARACRRSNTARPKTTRH
ncbi:MAG: hypothetical protein ACFB50_15240 [Rubrobacteraceae bacterium]